MLLMFLGIGGVWDSPFLLLLASPSLLEFMSMARLNVYVLWGKRRGCEHRHDMSSPWFLIMDVYPGNMCLTFAVRIKTTK